MAASIEYKLSVTDTDVFKELAKEIVFLRYFYKKVARNRAQDCENIKSNYCGEIPEGY